MNKNNKTLSNLLFIGFFLTLASCTEKEDSIRPEPQLPIEPTIYVDLPDENFERKLIELGFDTDDSINHRMLKSDALQVISLEVDSSIGTPEEEKITDLTGIEAFENLVFLSAGNNLLNEVNLSANTQLESIQFDANYLQSLDVSHNTKLTDISLVLNDLTKITGLNEATNLKTLNLSWNYLEDLSVNNASLEGLNVENNLLATLNVTGCGSLTSIIAKQNALKTIDLSTNIALKYVTLSANNMIEMNLENNLNIEKLWLSWNELKSLDVGNLALLNLLDIRQNSALTCIKIAQGQLIDTVNKQDHQELNTDFCP
ncbi:MAG: hypothetical protein RIC03_12210 [Cyclobacteriaceae bacterium]